jgi:hypothetical protein
LAPWHLGRFEVFHGHYANSLEKQCQTPQAKMQNEIAKFKKFRTDLVACHPLEDRKMLEEAGNINHDRLFRKVRAHNREDNRGATVLVHLAEKSKLLQAR